MIFHRSLQEAENIDVLLFIVLTFLYTGSLDPNMHQSQAAAPARTSSAAHTDSPGGTPGALMTPNPPVSGNTPTPVHFTPPPPPPPTNADSLLDLLRRYPVMWQGLFALKNDSAAVQMHYISGMDNSQLLDQYLEKIILKNNTRKFLVLTWTILWNLISVWRILTAKNPFSIPWVSFLLF